MTILSWSSVSPMLTVVCIATMRIVVHLLHQSHQDDRAIVAGENFQKVQGRALLQTSAGSSCAHPVDIASRTSPLYGDTSNSSNFVYNIGIGSSAAKDMVFTYMLPPFQNITIQQSGNAFDSVHELRYGGQCPGTSVVQTVDDPDSTPISWHNSMRSPQPVYFLLSGYNSGSVGTFELTWEYTIAGSSCSNPVDLALYSPPYHGNTSQSNNFVSFSNTLEWSSAAKDMVFSYLLQPDQNIAIRQVQNSFDSVHELRYGGLCPGDNVVHSVDDPDETPVSWTNSLRNAQPVYFLLSGHSDRSEGAFTLVWSVSATGSNISCACSSSSSNCPISESYEQCGGSGLVCGALVVSNAYPYLPGTVVYNGGEGEHDVLVCFDSWFNGHNRFGSGCDDGDGRCANIKAASCASSSSARWMPCSSLTVVSDFMAGTAGGSCTDPLDTATMESPFTTSTYFSRNITTSASNYCSNSASGRGFVFRFTVSPGQTLTVLLDSLGNSGSGYLYTANAGEPCSESQQYQRCVYSSASISNRESTSLEAYYVHLTDFSGFGASYGTVTLNWELFYKGTCSHPVSLLQVEPPLTLSTTYALDSHALSCGTASAPDVVFADITVPAGGTIRMRQTNANYDSVRELRYRGSCPGLRVAACTRDAAHILTWTNNQAHSEAMYFIQSGATSSDKGIFTTTWDMTIPGSTCQTAISLASEHGLTFSDSQYGGPIEGARCTPTGRSNSPTSYKNIVFAHSLRPWSKITFRPQPSVYFTSSSRWYQVRHGGACPGDHVAACTEDWTDDLSWMNTHPDDMQQVYLIKSSSSGTNQDFALIWNVSYPGTSCEDSVPLSDHQSPLSFYVNSASAKSFFEPECTGRSSPRPDLVFVQTVLPNAEITLQLTASAGDNNFAHELRLGGSADCPGYITLACKLAADRTPISWRNSYNVAQKVYYFVQSGMEGNIGIRFELSWTLTGDCAAPIDLTGKRSPYTYSLEGSADSLDVVWMKHEYQYDVSEQSGDVVFTYTLQRGDRIQFEVQSNFNSRHELRYGGECPGLFRVDQIQDLPVAWMNTRDAAQQMYFVQSSGDTDDSDVSRRQFQLEWSVSSPGLSCAEPIDLGNISSPLTYSTSRLANVLLPSCARSSTAADVVFSLNVPAGLTVEFQQRFSNYDSVAELRHGGACPGDNLIQCVVHATQGVSETLEWKNSASHATTVFYLQTGTADSHGQFTIAWRVYASDGDCSAPIDLRSVGSPYTSVVARRDAGDLEFCYGTSSFFVLATYPLNPSQVLELNVYVHKGYVDVRLGGECPGTSLHRCDYAQSMSRLHFSLLNPDNYVLQVYIGVSSFYENNPFTLEWNIFESGSTCALATDFSDFPGGIVRGSTADSQHSLQSQCGSDAAPDVVYKYLLPPGETITIRRIANDYAMTGELRMDYACPGYALVACLGYEINSRSEISYTNTDPFAVDMYYIQSGESENSMGLYELQVDVGQAVGGGESPCDSSFDLASITSPFTSSTYHASDAVSGSCGLSSASSVVFSAWLRPGWTLIVYQIDNNYDSVHELRYGGACPGDVLVRCIDDPDIRSPVSWTNNMDDAQHVYYVQSGYSNNKGNFTISWNFTLQGTCDHPLFINNYTSGTIQATTDHTSDTVSASSCGAADAKDVILTMEVPPRARLVLRLVEQDYLGSGELRVGGECPGHSAVLCMGSTPGSELTWLNPSSTAQNVYFILSGMSEDSSGESIVEWEMELDGSCESPFDLSAQLPPFTLMPVWDTETYDSDYDYGDRRGYLNSFMDVVFTHTVPVGGKLVLHMESNVDFADRRSIFQMRAMGACPGDRLMVMQHLYGFREDNLISVVNVQHGLPLPVYMILSDDRSDNGSVAVSWEFFYPGASCDEVVRLGPSATEFGSMWFQPSIAGSNILTPTCSASISHPDLVFSLDLPPSHRLQLVLGGSTARVVQELRRGGTCPGSVSVLCASDTTDMVYENPGPSTEQLYYIVQSASLSPLSVTPLITYTGAPAGTICCCG